MPETNVKQTAKKAKPTPLKKTPTKRKKPSVEKLKVLVLIVNKNKSDFYIDLLQSMDSNLQLTSLAHGTLTSSHSGLFDLETMDKTVTFAVVQATKAHDILQKLNEKFESIKDGKGVAVTIPMDSVIGLSIYEFLSNNRTMEEV